MRSFAAVEVLQRRRLIVRGAVQGVGFRPFVHRIAGEMSLEGHVRNTTAGVVVDVQGPAVTLDEFTARMLSEHPPLAVIEGVEIELLEPAAAGGFWIVASTGTGTGARVPPDAATCPACLAEMRNPASRRAGHAFISCTDCGPRFTIALGLPFDRGNTTMAPFGMCAACRSEYEDPADRRFHSQTIACPGCGPALWLKQPDGESVTGDRAALDRAQAALAQGAIVAVKGIGGWHLACDAANENAVAQLRRRKGRGEKPFAVMCPDVHAARRLGEISESAARLLQSSVAPITLVPARHGARTASALAPGSPLAGLLLAYTPVHHLLFSGAPFGALVMTSGNRSDEPIATSDPDARSSLAGIADMWLGHDREIAAPCDDSVVRVHGDRTLAVRRARGLTPVPLTLRGPSRAPAVLAVGGDVKCAPALAHRGHVIVGQHIGDLDGPGGLQALERAAARLQRVTSVTARTLACDPHPGYRGSVWARRVATGAGMPAPLAVQHHHAHIAAVMAEHGLDGGEPVLGIAFDGTGYGVPDGTIWGGEMLLADYRGFRRVGHLRAVPLPGGDAAVRNPARVALAHLHVAGVRWDPRLPCVAACTGEERMVLARMLESGAGCTTATSAGRLFDAVASLAGVRHISTYEGQAAVELEAAGARAGAVEGYPVGLTAGSPLVLDTAPLMREAARDVLRGAGSAHISARFHAGLATASALAALRLAQQAGTDTVALGGGVFANMLLLDGITLQLQAAGMRVLTAERFPANDGGLALGQAAVASACASEP